MLGGHFFVGTLTGICQYPAEECHSYLVSGFLGHPISTVIEGDSEKNSRIQTKLSFTFLGASDSQIG